MRKEDFVTEFSKILGLSEKFIINQRLDENIARTVEFAREADASRYGYFQENFSLTCDSPTVE